MQKISPSLFYLSQLSSFSHFALSTETEKEDLDPSMLILMNSRSGLTQQMKDDGLGHG